MTDDTPAPEPTRQEIRDEENRIEESPIVRLSDKERGILHAAYLVLTKYQRAERDRERTLSAQRQTTDPYGRERKPPTGIVKKWNRARKAHGLTATAVEVCRQLSIGERPNNTK